MPPPGHVPAAMGPAVLMGGAIRPPGYHPPAGYVPPPGYQQGMPGLPPPAGAAYAPPGMVQPGAVPPQQVSAHHAAGLEHMSMLLLQPCFTAIPTLSLHALLVLLASGVACVTGIACMGTLACYSATSQAPPVELPQHASEAAPSHQR